MAGWTSDKAVCGGRCRVSAVAPRNLSPGFGTWEETASLGLSNCLWSSCPSYLRQCAVFELRSVCLWISIYFTRWSSTCLVLKGWCGPFYWRVWLAHPEVLEHIACSSRQNCYSLPRFFYLSPWIHLPHSMFKRLWTPHLLLRYLIDIAKGILNEVLPPLSVSSKSYNLLSSKTIEWWLFRYCFDCYDRHHQFHYSTLFILPLA